MKIHATPELCRCIYTMLCCTSPFARWKLPPAEEVVFAITVSPDRRGEYFWPGNGLRKNAHHRIEISQRCHGTLHSLTKTMAHEMVHLREYLIGERLDVKHSGTFFRLAKQVCSWHGFELQEF